MKLETKNLILREFVLEDAKELQKIAGDFKIYEYTGGIPHPYPDGHAEEWIRKHEDWKKEEKRLPFAVLQKSDQKLVGCVELFGISKEHRLAELGYWIGVDFWGKGYATESSKALLNFGFEDLDLHRICARAFSENQASIRVLENLGMKFEGCHRDEVFKLEKHHDILYYGLLKKEWSKFSG